MPFQILAEFPEHTVGNSCCCCHADRRKTDRLIDLGFYTDTVIDYDGQPAIREGYAIMCETCAKEIASMLGYITEDMSERVAALYRENQQLLSENTKMREAMDFAVEAIRA
jgi:uncharacterized Zn-binding protein involved in type VI secretion